MFPELSQDIRTELQELASTYGTPLVQTIDLGTTTVFDPLNARDRYGEVCMVIRRKNGLILTSKKTFYPAGAFRLLTGGINFGERVYDALQRETYEETALKVHVRQFLAALSYTLAGQQKPVFYTFAFLLDEVDGVLQTIDKEERVEAFREVPDEDLPKIANMLRHIQSEQSREIGGNWHDWGVFRAAIHDAVSTALVL